MKTIIGLAIGIILAAAVIIPLTNARTEAELEAQRTQIALEAAQTELETLKTAQTPETSAGTTQISGEPHEIIEITALPLVTEPQEIQAEPEVEEVEEAIETAAVEVKTEPEPAPEPVRIAETPPPQPKAAEPEYFYEDGKRYAYINGIKSHIADEADSVQLDYYDWANDPAGQIKGPFN